LIDGTRIKQFGAKFNFYPSELHLQDGDLGIVFLLLLLFPRYEVNYNRLIVVLSTDECPLRICWQFLWIALFVKVQYKK
jgi:hypothetical protein